MREIIFRGKRVEDGKWLYGYYSDEKAEDTDFPCIVPLEPVPDYDWEVDPETVGQYTGLFDKNGTKIFEGDVVKGASEYFGNSSLNQKAVVLYDRGQFLFAFGETLTDCKQLEDFEVVTAWNSDVEVIGNIHDNPELLGDENNE